MYQYVDKYGANVDGYRYIYIFFLWWVVDIMSIFGLAILYGEKLTRVLMFDIMNFSPIYNTDEWSPSGDVYVGGKN